MNTHLVAIMLTDMSGFTSFTAHSERSTLAAAVEQQQRLILPLIEGFSGRLVKWIGDAALAVFPSVADAVECGHRVQLTFIEHAERSLSAIPPRVKVVVHAGDAIVDRDGDVYGDCVNFAARMEKAAEPDEVYFSEAVRMLLNPAEIPWEPVGDFEFHGITGRVRLYRTAFGQTPVVRERAVLVQTNFVSVQDLADAHGWDVAHPALDAATGALLEAARRHGGTNRGTLQLGSFFTFPDVSSCLSALGEAADAIRSIRMDGDGVGVRVGVHVGTLHIMRHTMMGRDIDITRTIAALGGAGDVLFTGAAIAAGQGENAPLPGVGPLGLADLRECGSKRRWLSRYADMPVFAMRRAQATAPDAR